MASFCCICSLFLINSNIQMPLSFVVYTPSNSWLFVPIPAVGTTEYICPMTMTFFLLNPWLNWSILQGTSWFWICQIPLPWGCCSCQARDESSSHRWSRNFNSLCWGESKNATRNAHENENEVHYWFLILCYVLSIVLSNTIVNL